MEIVSSVLALVRQTSTAASISDHVVMSLESAVADAMTPTASEVEGVFWALIGDPSLAVILSQHGLNANGLRRGQGSCTCICIRICIYAYAHILQSHQGMITHVVSVNCSDMAFIRIFRWCNM